MKPSTRIFKKVTLLKSRILYRAIIRPLLFRFDSEKVHGVLIRIGEWVGKVAMVRRTLRSAWRISSPAELGQILHGIYFENPVGLAAGFDYDAQLPHALPALGFGFGSVGTITNKSYEGNPLPRLGRLVRSRSLMVDKGFKNAGIRVILERLASERYEIPIGLSIGKTNSREIASQEEAIADIVSSFRAAENSSAPFAYYELNISCPNLYGDVEFYSPRHLDDLLRAITTLQLKKPIFLKMPIEKSEHEVSEMVDVITAHPIQGIIIGNLRSDRRDASLDPAELERYPRGSFSGKPTQKRSDELIRFAYRKCGKKLTIMGCGGIFSAEDAYRKIRLGASLVELVTGLVFEGPQLAGAINLGLLRLMARDGVKNIREAVGKDA